MANFVLVHGGAHGGWCFQPLARVLREQRARGLHADVDGTRRAGPPVPSRCRPRLPHRRHRGRVALRGSARRHPRRSQLWRRGHHRRRRPCTRPCRPTGCTWTRWPRETASRWWISRALSWRRHNWTAGSIDGVEMCLFPSDETLPYYGVVDPETLDWMRERLTPHPCAMLPAAPDAHESGCTAVDSAVPHQHDDVPVLAQRRSHPREG